MFATVEAMQRRHASCCACFGLHALPVLHEMPVTFPVHFSQLVKVCQCTCTLVYPVLQMNCPHVLCLASLAECLEYRCSSRLYLHLSASLPLPEATMLLTHVGSGSRLALHLAGVYT